MKYLFFVLSLFAVGCVVEAADEPSACAWVLVQIENPERNPKRCLHARGLHGGLVREAGTDGGGAEEVNAIGGRSVELLVCTGEEDVRIGPCE
jgi:hypothetical protein